MNEETLFHLALQKPAAERAAFLNEACSGDVEVRQRLEVLLRAHEDRGNPLDQPPVDPALTTDANEPAVPPGITSDFATNADAATWIGPYKRLKTLGEGGMGTVFLAEQEQPVKRRVALKIIKAGMDSAQVVARFEQERQALAVMDHPNIAKVFEAGTTDLGRPYFVMELVHGIPITKYCDQEHLTPKERLELFIPVCQAVQHAHQKGIIHRDLKPSNVLVALYDGKPISKVIDFGVAKATAQKMTERTTFTEVGQIVGTLEYMAPEQAELTNLDIDTRADIYSLGVILYELLTGSPPFTSKQLRGAAFTEMLRMIREVEPSKPSTKLSSSDELPSIAANRKLEPKKLTNLVHGELDWIVMKCLEKERTRRYETANGLALDVQRYLADEHVLACPPSAGYRLRKFVRRNKRTLAVGACLLLAATLTGISAFWQVQAQSARAAETAERQAETERVVTAALVEAETLNAQGWKQIDDPDRWQATVGLSLSAVQRAEALVTTGVATAELAEWVQAVRSDVDEAGRASTLRAALDRIRLEKDTSKKGRIDKSVLAPLYEAAFRAYGIELGTASAERLRSNPLFDVLLAALEDWERSTPDKKEWQRLGELLRELEPAQDAFRTQWRAARRKGPTLTALAQKADVDRLPAAALATMAYDLRYIGEWLAAERLLRAAQERYPDDFWLNHDLGVLLHHQTPPRLDEAARFLTAALALRSRSPAARINLGTVLHDKKDLDGAIRQYRQALDLDPKNFLAHNNIGISLAAKGDLEGAIRHFRQALFLYPKLSQFHVNLGLVLKTKGDLEEAICHFRQALDLDPKNANTYYDFALALQAKGDLEGTIAANREAIALRPAYAEAHCNLGHALQRQGQFAEALAAVRRGHELGIKIPGWPYPSAQWVTKFERCVELDGKLVAVLENGVALSKEETREFGHLCMLKRWYATAARFYEKSYVEQKGGTHFMGIQAAAMAGSGQGEDAAKLDGKERTRWRQQALAWLQADFAVWKKQLGSPAPKTRASAESALQNWLRSPDLRGVREEKAIDQLPETERAAWRQLWTDVAALLPKAPVKS